MLKASLENVWPTVLDRNTTNDPTRNMNGLRMPFNDKITKLDNPELKKWQNEYAGIDEEHRPPKPRDAFRIPADKEEGEGGEEVLPDDDKWPVSQMDDDAAEEDEPTDAADHRGGLADVQVAEGDLVWNNMCEKKKIKDF